MTESCSSERPRRVDQSRVRRAIGQDSGLEASHIQALQHVWYFRKSVEFEVHGHQPVANGAVGDCGRVQREVESLAGHLPEVHVPALDGSQPTILKLFFTPKRIDLIEVLPKDIPAARSCRSVVEQSPVSVKNACTNAFQAISGHVDRLFRDYARFDYGRSGAASPGSFPLLFLFADHAFQGQFSQEIRAFNDRTKLLATEYFASKAPSRWARQRVSE